MGTLSGGGVEIKLEEKEIDLKHHQCREPEIFYTWLLKII